MPEVVTPLETELDGGLPGSGGGEGELVSHGEEFQSGKMRKSWRRMVGTVTQQCECAPCCRTVHLNMVKMVNCVSRISYHNKISKTDQNKNFISFLKRFKSYPHFSPFGFLL